MRLSSAAFASLFIKSFVFIGWPACWRLAKTLPTSVFCWECCEPSVAPAVYSMGFNMYSSAMLELLAMLRRKLTSGELLIFAYAIKLLWFSLDLPPYIRLL